MFAFLDSGLVQISAAVIIGMGVMNGTAMIFLYRYWKISERQLTCFVESKKTDIFMKNMFLREVTKRYMECIKRNVPMINGKAIIESCYDQQRLYGLSTSVIEKIVFKGSSLVISMAGIAFVYHAIRIGQQIEDLQSIAADSSVLLYGLRDGMIVFFAALVVVISIGILDFFLQPEQKKRQLFIQIEEFLDHDMTIRTTTNANIDLSERFSWDIETAMKKIDATTNEMQRFMQNFKEADRALIQYKKILGEYIKLQEDLKKTMVEAGQQLIIEKQQGLEGTARKGKKRRSEITDQDIQELIVKFGTTKEA